MRVSYHVNYAENAYEHTSGSHLFANDRVVDDETAELIGRGLLHRDSWIDEDDWSIWADGRCVVAFGFHREFATLKESAVDWDNTESFESMADSADVFEEPGESSE